MAENSPTEVTPEEFQSILDEMDQSRARRAALMPNQQTAIRALFEAFDRLRELGWREGIYCPKDGSEFEVIEAGSEHAESILALAHNPAWITLDGRVFHRQADLPDDVPCRLVERIGKTRAGRLLDGREHNEVPG